MAESTKRGQQIKHFILESVSEHPADIAKVTSHEFAITRQAVNRYLQELQKEGLVDVRGATRARQYSLATLSNKDETLSLSGLEEDVVWRDIAEPYLKGLAQNVLDILHYGFTEIVNNAIDHSDGEILNVSLKQDAVCTRIQVTDDGIGIFKKICKAVNLPDERMAVLELAKGKLTTDPDNHSGEGIFFTSRVMDRFLIFSGDITFSHEYGREDDQILDRGVPFGTVVVMYLKNKTNRTLIEVFNKYASEDEDYGFTKTVVPVRMLKVGSENLVSRSQAKRLLSRFENFKTVILDFDGIDMVGQAFADEIFRVFAKRHPDLEIIPIKMQKEVKQMVARARSS